MAPIRSLSDYYVGKLDSTNLAPLEETANDEGERMKIPVIVNDLLSYLDREKRLKAKKARLERRKRILDLEEDVLKMEEELTRQRDAILRRRGKANAGGKIQT